MDNIDTRQQRKYANGDKEPCLKEGDLSMNCLKKNKYDKEKCAIYFLNYRNCKQFWGMIKKERVLLGIQPSMPTEKERELIKAELKKGHYVISVPLEDTN